MSAKKAKLAKPRATKEEAAKVKVNLRVRKSAPKTRTSSVGKPSAKAGTQKDKQTRVEILQALAQKTNMTRVQIENIFDELNNIICSHINKRGSGEIIIPKTGIKVRRVKKKASKPRTMVSPLTGQEVTIAAKPVRYAVKLSALKPLKQMLEA